MINHKYKGPTPLSCLHNVSLCLINLEFVTTEIYIPLWTRLLKLLFNKQSINTKCRCRFHVYTACRFIYSIWNWQLQRSIDPIPILHPVCSTKTKTIHTKLVNDELANGIVLNFEVSILFQSLVSCFKTFIEFSE